MKALTLWNPWAALVAWELKKVETRCWSTSYRGDLAIHAAAKIPKGLGASQFYPGFWEMIRLHASGYEVDSLEWKKWKKFWEMPCGGVLCIVKLIDVIPAELCRDDLTEQERMFGNYSDDRYCWFLELKEKFDDPIPAKGNRMLWNWERL